MWCVDPLYDTSLLLTGSADNSCKLWDTKTGTCVQCAALGNVSSCPLAFRSVVLSAR